MKRWPTKPLEESYWFQEGPGVRKWQFRDSGIKLLNVANITKEGSLDLSKTDRYLAEEEVKEKYSHFLADDGDLVIASSGISFDEDGLLRTRGAFVEPEHRPLCINTSTIRFKSKEGVSTLAWLRYWLDSVEFREQITRLVTGSAQQNFGPSHLKATKITLPPLAEQERIVKLLDEADALRKLRTQTDRRTAALIPALFQEMFSDLAINRDRWPFATLGELVKFVGGGTPSRARPEFFAGTIPWATSKDVKNDYMGDTQEHVTEEAIASSATNLVPAGSVLVVVKSKILMHSLPVAITTVPMCFGQDLKGLVSGGKVLPHFIASSLRAQKDAILAQARGANTEGLTLDILRAVKIPLPPLSLQKEFAQRVTEIRELEARQATSRTRLDALFQSLLHRAFNGQL